MRCQRCHRELKAPPMFVGRYPYGPKCFDAMFPPSKRIKRERVVIVVDDATLDLFAGCYFDIQGAADRAAIGAT